MYISINKSYLVPIVPILFMNRRRCVLDLQNIITLISTRNSRAESIISIVFLLLFANPLSAVMRMAENLIVCFMVTCRFGRLED